MIAAPVGVVHSPFTLFNLIGTPFKISIVAGAGIGITPCSHFTNPEPTDTVLAQTLSTQSKSTNIEAPTISTIESIAPTS